MQSLHISDAESACAISRRATSRVTKHGLNVYPLEAFGLLVGRVSPIAAYAALPVGKTSRWYDCSDRFAGLVAAIDDAAQVAGKFGLDVVGAYHSHSGGHPQFPGSNADPMDAVPPHFSIGILLVTDTAGGESLFGSACFRRDKEDRWQLLSYRIVPGVQLDPPINARRIHHAWTVIRGPVDFSNNHEG